jgi:hypothetical protein
MSPSGRKRSVRSGAWPSVPGMAAVVLGLLLLGACRKEEAGPLLPGDYTGWARTTEKVLDYPIPGHEDRGRRIYINRRGTEVRVGAASGRVTWSYPEGSIIVKEIFGGLEVREGDKPVMLTAMVKDMESPQARGGWVWVVKDLASGNERIIDWEFCVDCHANANEPHPYGDKNEGNEFRDYVYFPYRRP